MSIQWDGELPTSEERWAQWADQALFTEERMRFDDGGSDDDGGFGGDGSGGGDRGSVSARVWRRWLVTALVFYTILLILIWVLR